MFQLLQNSRMGLEPLPPAVLMSSLMLLGCAALFYSHPLYLLVLFAVCVFGSLLHGRIRKLRQLLGGCLVIGLLVVVTNVVFSSSGQTVVYEFKRIDLEFLGFGSLGFNIEPVRITVEALVFGVVMCLRLLLVTSVCWLFGELVSLDSSISVLSRLAPRVSLILSIAALMMPRLARRSANARIALQQRVPLAGSVSLKKRLQTGYLVLRVSIIGALEDAWAVAVSLYARGFRSGDRTVFQRNAQNNAGSVLCGIVVALGALVLISLYGANGQIVFYPELDMSIELFDVLLVVAIFVGYSGLFLLHGNEMLFCHERGLHV